MKLSIPEPQAARLVDELRQAGGPAARDLADQISQKFRRMTDGPDLLTDEDFDELIVILEHGQMAGPVRSERLATKVKALRAKLTKREAVGAGHP